MLHCPVTQQFCLALSAEKCGQISEVATRANPHFFICFGINNISNFGAVTIIQVFHLLNQYNAKSPAFSFSCKVFILRISGKKFENITVIQTSTVPHKSVQISCTTKSLFCWCAFHPRTKWVSLKSSISKNSPLLNNVYICNLNK